MPRSLRLYITGVVTASALALGVATLVFPADQRIALDIPRISGLAATDQAALEMLLGLVFWTVVELVASALPVKLPHGTYQAVGLAPLVAAMTLGGPAVGGWVAAIGSTETREIRGGVPWYGTLVNHAGIVLPIVIGGMVRVAIASILSPGGETSVTVDFASSVAGAMVFFVLNTAIAGGVVALRTGQSIDAVLAGDSRDTAFNSIGLAPIGWLMAVVYSIQWWATLLFALPLYTTRMAARRFVEMREMFTQTIGALAAAVDKRDPYTARHSENVKKIAVDIGQVMHVSDSELEALEWGGLLHDVGKIGVPDDVLKKPERLTRAERMVMNSHPVLGAEIIAPVDKLAAELPIIRHHHEWYNGSGYPDRLIGDEIPKLARILHVADAFEAMTAARPYRMTPLSTEEALAELRKFAGVQFDPEVVDAFVKTDWVEGVPDAGRPDERRPIPLLAQAAAERAASGRADASISTATTATVKAE
ncbi:MAG: HD-GYP domain-containing protein [Chloroflexi bacterium]|nr:HD-GYP domain-containing protein [Chloroflexota bacterium]